MVLRLKPMGKLITCDNYLGTRQNQNLFPLNIKYSPSSTWVLGARQLRETDALASPWATDRTMVRHDLLGSFISKLALTKWLHSLHREAHHRKLGCSRKGGGRAKNIYIRKISKQKEKIYI